MRIRHLSGAVATLMVAPALTVLPVAQPSATPNPTPVPTSERRVDLLDADAPQTGDADQTGAADLKLARDQMRGAGSAEREAAGTPSAAAAPEPVVLEASAPQNVPGPVAVAGVTFTDAPPAGTVVQYRTRATGSGWQAWEAIDSDSVSRLVDRTGDGSAVDAEGGSDPIVLAGAAQVQVRVLAPKGSKPVAARLSIIDPGTAAQDSKVGTAAPGTAHAAAARPTIYTRAQWGADESLRKNSPTYTAVRGVIVHHTAGTNNYTSAQVPAILRGIYAFHTKDRGWDDIGYNMLVDKFGRIWEGRFGGLAFGVQGAHASGWNKETMGISYMGDTNRAAATSAGVGAMQRAIAWKAGVHGFDPDGSSDIYGRWRPVIQGHRNVGTTSCPGASLYALLPSIRRASAQLAGTYGGSGATPMTMPTAGLQASDVLMRGRTNVLLKTSPVGSTGMSYSTQISSRDWRPYDKVLSAGDFDGDGFGDVLARHAASGDLYLFPGNSQAQLGVPTRVGTGWQGMRQLSAGVDLTGDRRPDVVAVDSAGVLWVYPSTGRGTFGTRISSGRGWSGLRSVVSLGDWDGNGVGDVLGVLPDGRAYVYPFNGKGAWRGGRTLLATNFRIWTTLVGTPGTRAVFGLTSAGSGYMIRRYGTTTVRSTRVAPSFAGLSVYAG